MVFLLLCTIQATKEKFLDLNRRLFYTGTYDKCPKIVEHFQGETLGEADFDEILKRSL